MYSVKGSFGPCRWAQDGILAYKERHSLGFWNPIVDPVANAEYAEELGCADRRPADCRAATNNQTTVQPPMGQNRLFVCKTTMHTTAGRGTVRAGYNLTMHGPVTISVVRQQRHVSGGHGGGRLTIRK